MPSRTNRRAFLRAVGVGAAAVAMPAGTRARATTRRAGGEPFFFLQIADPQLFWGPLELWKTAIRHANRLKPDFVVVCGDLLHRAADVAKLDAAEDEKMARACLDVAKTLDKRIPLYYLAGNHDVCNEPTPETLRWYEKRFGKLWYRFTHKGSFFVALESDLFKHPAGAREAAARQLKWLEKTLGEASKREHLHKVVFLHHPLCLKAVDEKESYSTLPIPIRRRLLKLFHAHGVEATFSGHHHKNAYVRDGKLELVTTSSSGKPLGKDPAGFRIVKVYPDRIEHRYYGYDDLPDKVVLAPAGRSAGGKGRE